MKRGRTAAAAEEERNQLVKQMTLYVPIETTPNNLKLKQLLQTEEPQLIVNQYPTDEKTYIQINSFREFSWVLSCKLKKGAKVAVPCNSKNIALRIEKLIVASFQHYEFVYTLVIRGTNKNEK